MKAIKKYFALAAAAALSLAFTACSDKDDYTPATAEANDQVYFDVNGSTKIGVETDQTSFAVPVYRIKTADAITVPLTVSDSTGFLSVPTSVKFDANQSMTTLDITYDPSKMEYDVFKKVSITIDPAYQTAYGLSTYTFEVGAYSPYELMGTGTWIDDYFGFESKVEIYQNKVDRNTYRVMYPFAENDYASVTPSDYLQFTVLKKGENVNGVDVNLDDLVYFTKTNTGYVNGTYNCDVWYYHPSDLINRYTTLGFDNSTTWAGSYVNEYMSDATTPGEVVLSPFAFMPSYGDGGAGWNYTTSELVHIYMPGFTPKDYSLECTFLGTNDNPLVGIGYAYLTVKKGSDVSLVSCYAVKADADLDEILYAIDTDEIVGVDADANGEVQVPIPGSEAGYYKVIVVAFKEEVDDEGNKALIRANYQIVPVLYKYNAVAIGTYSEGVKDLTGKEEAQFTSVYNSIIYQSNDDSTAYAVMPWFADGALMFNLDAETSSVTIAKSWSNYFTDYGEIFGMDLASLGAPSYYDAANKTFHFRLGYMVDAGAYSYQEDTFTLTSEDVDEDGTSDGARKKANKKGRKLQRFNNKFNGIKLMKPTRLK